MATVAEQLRKAREQRGLSIYQVAEATKIKTDHVRALEEGNYDAFVAPVYIRGFVRTYAALVKLETPAVLAALDEELGKTERFRQPPSLSTEPPTALDQAMLWLTRVPWRIVLPLGAVLVAGTLTWWGVHAWQQRRARDPLEKVGPGLYQPPKHKAADTLLLPPAQPARR